MRWLWARAVADAHKKYVAALRALWNRHKDRYALERKGTLKIVDLPLPSSVQ